MLGGGGGGVVNNALLAIVSECAPLSISNQIRNLVGFNRIIFTSVINNYVLSFSSFLNKEKVKINGF